MLLHICARAPTFREVRTIGKEDMRRLSQDYLCTVAQYEQRIADLREQLRGTTGAMQRYRLRKRITALQIAVNDMRYNAHVCATYYDKTSNYLLGEVKISAKPTQKRSSGAKKRFSRNGYGLPTPAAAVCSRGADKLSVPSLGAVLLRGTDAARGGSDT